ncbi:MAG: DUF2513 domain-containing protein [bacterium]
MKRNMDLVRAILLAIEAEPSGFAPQKLVIPGHTDEEIGYHVYLMVEAGLLEGEVTTHNQSASPSALASHMTWEGHEFLDASRDLTRWERAKEIADKVGGVTYDMLVQILVKVMSGQIDELLP